MASAAVAAPQSALSNAGAQADHGSLSPFLRHCFPACAAADRRSHLITSPLQLPLTWPQLQGVSPDAPSRTTSISQRCSQASACLSWCSHPATRASSVLQVYYTKVAEAKLPPKAAAAPEALECVPASQFLPCTRSMQC